MKRDMEIVREILLAVEDQDASKVIDEDFLTGKVLRGAKMQIVAITITPPGLTWSGHDFLDVAKNDSVWKVAVEKVKEAGGSITFDLMKALLIKIAAKPLGLE